MTFPKRIYKYRSFDKFGLSILTEQEIYFSSPKNCNDPKDCRIPILYEAGTEKQMYHKNFENLKYPFPNLTRRERKAKARELAKLVYKKRDNEKLKKEFRQSLYEKQSNVGIFSASMINDNKLMWSHYADSHRGFCIEFDTDLLIRSLEIYMVNDIIPICNEINYSEKNLVINPYKLNDEQAYMVFYFTKSSEWSYEKEYRILIPRNPNTVFKMKEKTITSVILGAKCSSDNKNRMKEILTNIPYEILLKQMTYDDLEFDPTFEEIDYKCS